MTEFDFKKYCLNPTTFSFKVDEFEFSCGELSTEEEATFIEYYITETGKQNIVKLRMVQATKLIKQPFNNDWIKHIFETHYIKHKIESYNWNDLTMKERLMFISKLSNELVVGIVNKINEHYNAKNEEVKN